MLHHPILVLRNHRVLCTFVWTRDSIFFINMIMRQDASSAGLLVRRLRQRQRRRGLPTGDIRVPKPSPCMRFLILCVIPLARYGGEVAAASGADVAEVEAQEVGMPITMRDIFENVERISNRVEQLALQVENLASLENRVYSDSEIEEATAGSPPPPPQQPPESALRRKAREKSAVARLGRDTQGRKWFGGDDDGSGDNGRGDRREGKGNGTAWLVVATFAHETWVFLQHANILLNPLCQRLDRGYGIALLRKRLYWVIAIVLAAYWARELLSMWAAASYFSPLTLQMVVVSTVYHLGKISLITLDASRGWSPTLGIMHLLMDHWHLSSAVDCLLCVKRFALQAFDTATHAFILRDMLRWDQDEYGHEEGRGGLGLQRTLIIVFAAWAMHAIANLVMRKSTATLVVELAKRVVGRWGKSGGRHRRKRSSGVEGGGIGGSFGALDGGRAEFACTSSCSHGHKRCEVCHLLTRDQPPALSRQKRVD